MRNGNQTSIGVAPAPLSKSHVQTSYSNKIICVELTDQIDHYLLNCSFHNGKTNPEEAVLERAANGYDFKKIDSIKQYEQPNFQFRDAQKQDGINYNYRLLIKEKNGVTYYSEIISCDN
jgi:hypothetical protein